VAVALGPFLAAVHCCTVVDYRQHAGDDY